MAAGDYPMNDRHVCAALYEAMLRATPPLREQPRMHVSKSQAQPWWRQVSARQWGFYDRSERDVINASA